MGYQIKFEDVLLPNWFALKTNRMAYTIPAKNIVLKDGSKGSITVDFDAITVFDKPIGNGVVVQDDLGNELAETVTLFASPKKDDLLEFVSEEDINETFIVYKKYVEHEESFVSDK